MKKILPISSRECLEWIMKKHYAKRKPRIQYGFGLYVKGVLEGVATYGYPATPFVARGLIGKEHEENVIELNRLVINSTAPKNSASFLVSNSLKMLPKKFSVIVSYADTSVGHIGYVYQATNFLYLGMTIDMKEWRKVDSNLHSQNVSKEKSVEERKEDDNYEQIQRPKKHRYVFLRGSKTMKKELRRLLKYEIQAYPKGLSKRYMSPDIKRFQSLLGEF